MIRSFNEDEFGISRQEMIRSIFGDESEVPYAVFKGYEKPTEMLDVYLGLFKYTKDKYHEKYKDERFGSFLLDDFQTDQYKYIYMTLMVYSRPYVLWCTNGVYQPITLSEVLKKLQDENVKKYMIDNLNYF